MTVPRRVAILFDALRRPLERLVREDGCVDATIRSLRHHRGKLRRGSERDDVVRRVIRYLSRYRDKMCYAEYRRRGLPIGSGPGDVHRNVTHSICQA